MSEIILRDRNKIEIKAKTDGQAEMVEAVLKNKVVLVDGPAGTGKTFLAAALAVRFLREGKVDKIVMSRPAVEAGEKIGFLPGTLEEKVDPYLRPLYDSLEMMFSFEESARLQHNRQLEVIPLAFMRGRTLPRSFLILDEAQNTTITQMKMFLTRIGEGSRMVVVGDSTQRDIPAENGGFTDAMRRLAGISDIKMVKLGLADIVRSDIAAKIVAAYEF